MTVALPDAELLTVVYLKAQSIVTNEVSSRVYTELPSSPTFPLLLVSRPSQGQVGAESTLDVASIQIEAYADDKFTSRIVAAAAQAALADADGWTHTTGYITTTVPLGGIQWLPDEDFEGEPKPRYVFDTSVYTRPL